MFTAGALSSIWRDTWLAAQPRAAARTTSATRPLRCSSSARNYCTATLADAGFFQNGHRGGLRATRYTPLVAASARRCLPGSMRPQLSSHAAMLDEEGSVLLRGRAALRCSMTATWRRRRGARRLNRETARMPLPSVPGAVCASSRDPACGGRFNRARAKRPNSTTAQKVLTLVRKSLL